jgi:hypothetical protein
MRPGSAELVEVNSSLWALSWRSSIYVQRRQVQALIFGRAPLGTAVVNSATDSAGVLALQASILTPSAVPACARRLPFGIKCSVLRPILAG